MSNDAGVDSSGEEETIVHVSHHALLDSGTEGGSDFFVCGVSFGFPWSVVLLAYTNRR
jgi:hypothetical protein